MAVGQHSETADLSVAAGHYTPRAWRDMLDRLVIPGEVKTTGRNATIVGQIRARQFPDGVTITRVESSAQIIVHDTHHLAKLPTENLIVILQTRGHSTMSQAGREISLIPGDIGIREANVPSQIRFLDDFDELVFKVPKHLLTSLLSFIPDCCGLRIAGRSGLGSVIASCLQTFHREVSSMSDNERRLVQNTVFELLAAGIWASEIGNSSKLTKGRWQHLRQIQSIIENKLSDPELSVSGIALEHGVSSRYLHGLFNGTGHSVGSYIRKRRLEKCASDLRNVLLSYRSISNIAFCWGFSDSGHFSRLFRRHFGVSPSCYRRRRLT